MNTWEATIRFLVAFGGGLFLLAGALAFFVWLLEKLDDTERK